ncbi:RNA-guided endonuclease InsQ/TnpB family protein [Nocardia amamiensis]|uniref:RNA-guided endonuclease InsQ/TnpB family protein n=1 Tax=Nocardia amamiensis TaxID=404578 RepID=UPI00147251C0|nr:RNA-guided endonuclease TnpB family protein [Nocardia amamiensis]
MSVAVEAADLHAGHRHPFRPDGDVGGWVGADRGLSAFLVAATGDGVEVDRVVDHPKPLAAALQRQRRLAKAVTRKQRGSKSRGRAVTRLARHHRRVGAVRAHFLHQVSNRLVKTHDRLVLEDLNITGLMANRHLSRAIADAGWGELARQLRYKQAWRGGQVHVVDRWFPSSRRCSRCGTDNLALRLADRVFACGCGLVVDRDVNAAVNLAVRAELDHARVREPETRAPVINAC